jgi:hypothetical protein
VTGASTLPVISRRRRRPFSGHGHVRAAGRTIADLARERDAGLVAIIKAIRGGRR